MDNEKQELLDRISKSVFMSQFVETLLWSETDFDNEGNCGENFEDYSASDIDVAGLKEIVEDCEGFETELEEFFGDEDFDRSQAGHDFCLTRNGHGAGFWDGDWERGDELTKLCRPYGTLGLMRGDEEGSFLVVTH